jgi:hypothetical protein
MRQEKNNERFTNVFPQPVPAGMDKCEKEKRGKEELPYVIKAVNEAGEKERSLSGIAFEQNPERSQNGAHPREEEHECGRPVDDGLQRVAENRYGEKKNYYTANEIKRGEK